MEQKMKEIIDLGDKILNETMIGNARMWGLQACTEAIKALAEVEQLKAERGSAARCISMAYKYLRRQKYDKVLIYLSKAAEALSRSQNEQEGSGGK